ncbi:MAG: L-aspartate--glyoxylate aminotransferase BhcA [Pseudomonadota bacterium]
MYPNTGVFSGQNPVFIPGPTNIPDRLRHAMNMPTSDHRAPDFADLLSQLLDDLKSVFKTTDAEIITFPASGTGGWEAAVTNTLSPGDKVLVAQYGMFSQRWIDLCRQHGLVVDVIPCEWGAPAPAEKFEERLRADRGHAIKAVLVTHNETSTGVVSDIAAVRRSIDASGHPALLFVDCVSSLASVDFRMDEWGVDIAVTGSQKGFMLATGMAIVGVSPKALAACDTARCPRAFFDFRAMLAANGAGGFPYTPPLQLISSLRESVDMLLAEGLENVFARHRWTADGVRRAVAAWGFSLCAHSPAYASDTVSAVKVPAGFDGTALTDHAYNAYGVSFGVGLGELAGKIFRIGHLGSLTPTMALAGLSTIEMAMKDLDYPITLGSGVAAAQDHYRHAPQSALQRMAA